MDSTSSNPARIPVLETESGIPVYRQIVAWYESAVIGGALAPGERLPTIRSLAVALKTNPNTIAKAYSELELRGFINTRVGSGTCVAERTAAPHSEVRGIRIEEAIAKCVRELSGLGVSTQEMKDLWMRYLEDM